MRAGAAVECRRATRWRRSCVDFAWGTRGAGRGGHPGTQFFGCLTEVATSAWRFEVVTSCEALEHAFAPVAFGSQVLGLLADGGVFCWVLSNVESLLTLVLGAEAPLFSGIYQKYFLHTGLFGRLLRRTDFTDVRFQTAVPCSQRIDEMLGRLVGDGPDMPFQAAIERLARAAEATPLGQFSFSWRGRRLPRSIFRAMVQVQKQLAGRT